MYNVQVKFHADSIEEASAFVGNLQSGATGNVDVMLTGAAATMDDGTITMEISYEEEAARRHWECVLQEAQMVNEHEHSFSTGESRQMEIDVMNDWLEYYYHSVDDLKGAKEVLTHYESLAKSLSKSEADWRALLRRR